MSKQRQTARAQRASAAAARAELDQTRRVGAARQRERRERRVLWWRRMRLWQNAQRRSDTRERLGTMVAAMLLVLLAVFVATRSVGITLATALVLVISTPVLILIFFDRRKR
ncbi:MAG: hypothetical protein ABI345_13735 [Jatrophihabitans sp.]